MRGGWILLIGPLVVSGLEHKKHHDHGLKNLRAFIKHLHEEYDKPISTRVQIFSDEAYRKRKAMEDQINSYDIE